MAQNIPRTTDDTPKPTELLDVAVVGGSFAGLTAALYLARGRKRLAVIDAGETRNRAASSAHGFLGQDGRPPAEIRAAGLRDLLAYPEAVLIPGHVTTIHGSPDDFTLTLADGGTLRARRVILAHGMRDILPDLPGLAQIWGQTAFQCPYCHGYELAGQPTGLLMSGAKVAEHAQFLTDWAPGLTVFDPDASAEDMASLAAAGIPVIQSPVQRIEAEGDRLRALHLADGRRIPLAVLYMVSRAEPASDLPQQLGCKMETGPQGPYVATDMIKATSVPGVFAAGDLARPVFGAVFAAADGAMAGVACQRSLALSAT